jgi:hypothetical protein
MLKRLILVAALSATNAFAQQNTDISGVDFSSGKGDAKLAALGREAASEGKRLVITAPQEWHKSIAAKVRAGGHADVVLRDGFYENVLVRVEDKPEPAKAEAEKAPLRTPAKTAAPPPPPTREVAPAVAAAPTNIPPPGASLLTSAAPPPAAAPVVAPPPVRAVAAAAAPKAAPVVDVGAIQDRLEQSLNAGRSAQGQLAVASLQPNDTIYVDGPVRAVVRREALKPVLYWLDGDLDLRRTELKEVATDRYQVVSAIRGEGTLRREFQTTVETLDAHEPADGSPVRVALERKFNDGHRITENLGIDRLRSGDVIYSEQGSAVVVRRDRNDLLRFWLDGSIDLHQSAVQADGANKYRILSDVVH